MEFTDANKLAGILLFIDFENAFGSVELTSIFRALELFNFGPNIRRWISRNGNKSKWRSPVLWNLAAFLPRKTLKKKKRRWTRPLQMSACSLNYWLHVEVHTRSKQLFWGTLSSPFLVLNYLRTGAPPF